jgi:putative spermidine/putrescine transport system permease protein
LSQAGRMGERMSVLSREAIDSVEAPVAGKPSRNLTAFWLIAPGVLWMALFLVIPIAMIVYVSFWTQTTFKIEPILTTHSWEAFFASDTYVGALWTTIRIWLIVLFMTLLVGYPTALFVGLFIKNKTLSTALLVLCVIPFWTSFLIRVLAWRPMLGKEGAINIILQALHITSAPIEALLFTELSVIIGMTQIYCVFMVGPIAFMLGRIDPNVIEAARDLGASFGRIFRTIILPLSMPGVVVGSIFVSVMVLGEFATASALSGRKVNMLGNIIVTQVGSLKWAFASVIGVILTILMGIVVATLLRVVDLKREL